MSRTEETRAVVERFIIGGERDFPVTDSNLAVFKTNLRALFEELVHPDIVLHGVPGVERGRDIWYDFYEKLGIAFPDSATTLNVMVVEDDKAAVDWTWEATHSAPLMGIPPTGIKLAVRGMTIERVENGQIVEHWAVIDQLSWLQQLGVIASDLSVN